MPRTVALRPIGLVRVNVPEAEIRGNCRNIVSEVVVDKKYAAGLEGIEGYSHIFVLFWLHLVTEKGRKDLVGHTPTHSETEGHGVFAVRSRNRPNPIGLAVVELLKRDGNVLKVKALDAVDGTPVLDLKPYDYIDRKDEIRVPDWWLKAHPASNPRVAATTGSGSARPADENRKDSEHLH